MPTNTVRYKFDRSMPGIFYEIYFPKKAAYYGAIFAALRDGFNPTQVVDYLKEDVKALRHNFAAYPELFTPNYYKQNKRRVPRLPTQQQMLKRIDGYKSRIEGYSVYSVDGMFFDSSNSREYEESTQVVRLMFRFKSSLEAEARENNCLDCLRDVCRWVIDSKTRSDTYAAWHKNNKKAFRKCHSQWKKKKWSFVDRYFKTIAKEAIKWVHDCALFVFCYLVKKFSDGVLQTGKQEQEIWIASFFNLNVNAIVRHEL